MLLHTARALALPAATVAAAKAHCDALDKCAIPDLEYDTWSHGLPTVLKVHRLLHLRDAAGVASANLPNPFNSPVPGSFHGDGKFTREADCILADIVRKGDKDHSEGDGSSIHAYHRAGPRKDLHFDPKEVRAAIVNCGGLCPGLNNVIRDVVEHLSYGYGVETIYGIRGGYRGFASTSAPTLTNTMEELPCPLPRQQTTAGALLGRDEWAPLRLTPGLVRDWHREGGSNLSSARGGFDEEKIIAFLERHRINQLYVIGGDGTHRGAYRLAEAVNKRRLNVAICGVPKT